MKPVTPGMRALFLAAGVLVLLAGLQLFVFSDRTERFFAWTVDPPLTAAFLGAAYWASVAFEWHAARARTWAEARIAVPAVLVFTALTLVTTLVHLDRFHTGDEHALGTRLVTWAWVGVYVVVPLLMVAVIVAQARVRGGDPPRSAPLPAWLRALVVVQAALLLALGVALLLDPEAAAALWPWPLTPLTGRAVGAWLLSLGIAAVHALVEGDARRLRPAAVAYLAFGVLEAVALLRYPGTPEWGETEAFAYVAFLASTIVTGVAALRLDRTAPPVTAGAPDRPKAATR